MTKKSDEEIQHDVGSIAFLFDEVTQESAEHICSWILNCNFAKERPSILNLVINSPGGDLNAAFAIIDIMRSSSIPIRTIGVGQIQSAGLMIFIAGTKGERVLTPSTCIMSHNFSWGTGGKHNELVAAQKEVHQTHIRQLDHYKLFTGLSKKDILKYLLPAEDVYLSAEEALQYKLCDRISLINT
jgi:ATP-dependent Clp protease protease subunit